MVCGNTSPGTPKSRTQLCLAIWGPVVAGRRTVHGGWYLPAKAEDLRAYRYACFGLGVAGSVPTMSAAAPLTATGAPPVEPCRRRGALPWWWPLAALTGAWRRRCGSRRSACRASGTTRRSPPSTCSTRSLGATLRAVVHTENTPPLWYVLEWAISRVLGTGAVALRLLSALAGVATVPVAWAIGRELAGRRAALACAALVAVNPLFVWYSQEARAYALFVLIAALAMLCFLRAEREPTPARMAAFAVSGSLALLTHYFAVFLLVPMVLWLLARPRAPPRGAAGDRGAGDRRPGAASADLGPGRPRHAVDRPLGRCRVACRRSPQYYLTGYSGAPLGHGVELLVALPILAGLALWALARAAPARGAGRADRAGARRGRDPPVPSCSSRLRAPTISRRATSSRR